MKLNVSFPTTLPKEKATLIVNTIALSNTKGYSISYTHRSLTQLYHSNLPKDKVDSIVRFLTKIGIEFKARFS